MELQGRIIMVLPLASGTSKAGNPWKKQEYVLETKTEYPRKVVFNFFNASVDNYPLQVGDDIVLTFELESRNYTGRDGVERWSTEVRGVRAEKVGAGMAAAPQGFVPQQPAAVQPQMAQPRPAVPQYPQAAAHVQNNGANDDLPF